MRLLLREDESLLLLREKRLPVIPTSALCRKRKNTKRREGNKVACPFCSRLKWMDKLERHKKTCKRRLFHTLHSEYMNDPNWIPPWVKKKGGL
jgi:hypothetical protein